MRRGGTTRRRTCSTRRCGRRWERTSSKPDRWSRRTACASTSLTTRGLGEQDLLDIEDLVNQHVLANEEMQTQVMDLDAAVNTGAMALFGEKYGDQVRVVSVVTAATPANSAAARTCAGRVTSACSKLCPRAAWPRARAASKR